jgi:hypothetical protein
VIRRDRYHANAPATATPPANASSSRSIRASQRWFSTVFGFATTIQPKVWRPKLSGRATPSCVGLPGSWNSTRTGWLTRTFVMSTPFCGNRVKAGPCPGKRSIPRARGT